MPLPPSARKETSELVTQSEDVVTAEKITFLTEEMATCEGEFSKRHNAPGCSSSLALVKKGPSRGNRTRGSLSAPASSMSTREAKKSQVKQWQPLSVSALLEYNLNSLPAPGSGEFLSGKSKTWKIQWNWGADRSGFRYRLSRSPSTENICRCQSSTIPLPSLHCVTNASTLNQNLRFEITGFVYTSVDWNATEMKAWLLTSASIQCSSQSRRDLRLSFESGSDWGLESNPVCQELMSRSTPLPY